jgi:hypothetical protein
MGFLLVTLVVFVFTSHELAHLYRFGHLVPLGLHVEVMLTTSDDILGVEGVAKIYNASLTNYGLLPVEVTVCDYRDWASQHATMLNYIVERRTSQPGEWQYVREWDSYGLRFFCRPSFEVTGTHRVRRRLWPGQTYRLGGGIPAQLGGFHLGDQGRFTVFLNADNDKNRAVSSEIFRVDQEPKSTRTSTPD